MPRGYRHFITALVGLTAAISLFWLVEDFSSISSRIENEAADRADEYQKDAQSYKQRRCLGLGLPEAEECQRKTDQTARENQRIELDLAAQRVTAWWTQIMGAAALVGMSLSVVGVWLVYTTFRETRRAAQIAQGNLESYQHAERGYVHIESGTYVPETALLYPFPTFSIGVHNPGRSGVRIKKIYGGWRENALAWQWSKDHEFNSIWPLYCKAGDTSMLSGPPIPQGKKEELTFFLGVIEYDTLGMVGRKTHLGFAMMEPVGGGTPFFVKLSSTIRGMPADT